MKLYICSTYYHLYITLIKQMINMDSADLVICDDIEGGKILTDKIADTALFSNVWYIKQREFPNVNNNSIFYKVFLRHRCRCKMLNKILPFKLENYKDIYIYHDGTPLGEYLEDSKCKYHLIEDSLDFYQKIKNTPQAKFVKKHNLLFYIKRAFRIGYFPLGDSPFLIDVEVNDKNNLQIPLKNIIECNREVLYKNLPSDFLQIFFHIFDISDLEKELLHNVENSAIILTQPLFYDGECTSEDEQLKIYRGIINELNNKFSKLEKILLKPHPRDKIDYSSLQAIELGRLYPIELLNEIVEAPFLCAVTVSSSSIKSINAQFKYNWYNGQFI